MTIAIQVQPGQVVLGTIAFGPSVSPATDVLTVLSGLNNIGIMGVTWSSDPQNLPPIVPIVSQVPANVASNPWAGVDGSLLVAPTGMHTIAHDAQTPSCLTGAVDANNNPTYNPCNWFIWFTGTYTGNAPAAMTIAGTNWQANTLWVVQSGSVIAAPVASSTNPNPNPIQLPVPPTPPAGSTTGAVIGTVIGAGVGYFGARMAAPTNVPAQGVSGVLGAIIGAYAGYKA